MSDAATPPPALELCGIAKRFGRIEANRGVSLRLRRGSIHGLIGENGAGKSTLANIIYGRYPPDAGEIRVDGVPVRLRSPSDAIRAGIGMVHQHFMLVESFTVLENLMLGEAAEGRPGLAAARASAQASLARLARDYGLAVDGEAVVGDLPVGLQQRVEIIKALHRGARILILDEPTAVLTPAEANEVFRILRVLAGEGRSVLLVTHKLKEVMAVTERVTVLRHGAVVADLATAEADPARLAELMIGRQPAPPHRTPSRPGPAILEVADLCVAPGSGTAVRDVSFAIHAGEILGIAGVTGNGQSELLEALAGLRPAASGRIRFQGVDITRSDARARRRLGVAHIPEDRLRLGLVAQFSAAETALLGRHDEAAFSCGGMLRRQRIATAVARWMRDYDVRPPDGTLPTAQLSGGNQQKLVCAREMERRPVLLLVGQPTRGVDVGAIELIHRRLLALRDAGAAILLVSVELDEIRALADRILVMSEGVVVGEASDTASERELGLMMAGVATAPAPAPTRPG